MTWVDVSRDTQTWSDAADGSQAWSASSGDYQDWNESGRIDDYADVDYYLTGYVESDQSYAELARDTQTWL